MAGRSEPVYTRFVKPQIPRPSDASRLHIDGLPTCVGHDSLLEALKELLDPIAVRDIQMSGQKTKATTRPGVLRLSCPEDVLEAIAEMPSGAQVFGHPIVASRVLISPNPKGPAVLPGDEGRALHVTNISSALSAPDAVALIKRFASQRCRVRRLYIDFEAEEPWVHCGSAYLTMRSTRDADKVLSSLQRKRLGGFELHLEPYVAPPQEPAPAVVVHRLRPLACLSAQD